MPVPNLFIIGAPKCGTTSLHRYLDQHPHISMSAVKEPKFFLTDGVRPQHRGPGDDRADRAYVTKRDAYEALFHYPPGPGAYAGESTPYYLWHPDAASRIHAFVPEARLVAVLREPTLRAYFQLGRSTSVSSGIARSSTSRRPWPPRRSGAGWTGSPSGSTGSSAWPGASSPGSSGSSPGSR